jgi:heterodisulfide reductase subunit B
LRFSFFRGCFIPVRLPHIESIAIKALGDVGVELQIIDNFSCCPEPLAFINDKLTGLAIAARNISIAEELGMDILTLCNGCSYTLMQANESLKSNEELREKVNDVLSDTNHYFKGTIEVKHFAKVLVEDIGLDNLRKHMEEPLTGLNIATHTGCHIISPLEIMRFDNPYDPVVLDQMVSTLGACPIDYDLKPLCCGWTLTNFGDKESANKLIGEKLESMKSTGADCITVICPQCFYQFDTGQLLAFRSLQFDFNLPVFFYLQLLALAKGYSLNDIGYKDHRVKNSSLEEKLRGL